MPDSPKRPPASPEQIALVQKLFLNHSEAVKGFLMALAPERSQVEDLLHTVFLAVVDKAADFEEGTNFVAWARAMARIEVLRARRESSRSPQSFSPELIETLADEAPDFDLSNTRIRLLGECMDTLNPKPRKAIELQYSKSLKPAEIAKRLNMAPASLYVLLARARALLRKCMERKLRDMEGR